MYVKIIIPARKLRVSHKSLKNQENLPKILKIVQKIIVSTINHVFHICRLLTVATPRNINIIVSDELDNIFKAYLTVVWDLCDIFDST